MWNRQIGLLQCLSERSADKRLRLRSSEWMRHPSWCQSDCNVLLKEIIKEWGQEARRVCACPMWSVREQVWQLSWRGREWKSCLVLMPVMFFPQICRGYRATLHLGLCSDVHSKSEGQRPFWPPSLSTVVSASLQPPHSLYSPLPYFFFKALIFA